MDPLPLYNFVLIWTFYFYFQDIIGVCKEALDVVSLTAKSSGKELRKRDVQLVDDTNREVRPSLSSYQFQ